MATGKHAFPRLTVDPHEGTVTGPGGQVRLEPKVMEVLTILAGHAGHVVSRTALLDAVWPGVVVTEHTLSRCIYQLREQLGKVMSTSRGTDDDPIETLPKRGYKLLAPIDLLPDGDLPTVAATDARPHRRRELHVLVILLAAIAAGIVILLYPQVMDRTTPTDTPAASIAVLPFENRSPDPDNAYFADGIHDDLLMLLSKVSDLKVVSRTSVERFRDSDESIPGISRQLGVSHVLEGAVQRVGSQVRINVQLIVGATDDHVWAEAYDRQLTAADIFSIQSEVAEVIAEALQATLSPAERDRLAAVPTQDLAAYEAYLLGKQHLAKRTSAELAAAVEYFQRAVAIDPDFALAYVGLADSYSVQYVYSGAPLDDAIVNAEQALEQALTIDDGLGEAYTTLGWLRQIRNDFVGAEAAYKHALELHRNYATAYHRYGNLLRIFGHAEAALAQHRKGLELDPLSAIIRVNLARDLDSLGRFDEALDEYRKTIEIDPDFVAAYASIGDIYWLAYGSFAQAIPWYRRAVDRDPENPVSPAWFGRLYLDLGAVDKARTWIDRAMQIAPESPDSNYAMALLLIFQNDEAQALQYAQKVVALHSLWVPEALAMVRNHDLETNQAAQARARYAAHYPALLSELGPEVNNSNYTVAVDLALVLRQTGERERAEQLLSRALAYAQKMTRMGNFGYGISDAHIHALRGHNKDALDALRRAIDQGWRDNWWYHLRHDPNLAALRGDPEFRALVAEIEADLRFRRAQLGLE